MVGCQHNPVNGIIYRECKGKRKDIELTNHPGYRNIDSEGFASTFLCAGTIFWISENTQLMVLPNRNILSIMAEEINYDSMANSFGLLVYPVHTYNSSRASIAVISMNFHWFIEQFNGRHKTYQRKRQNKSRQKQ